MSGTLSVFFPQAFCLRLVLLAVLLCTNLTSQASESGKVSLNLDASTPHSFAEVYLDSDSLSGSFDLTVDPADVGKQALLYMAALVEDRWYLRGFFGWEPWDGNPAELRPFASVTLASEINYWLFTDEQLAAGNYRVWGAYRAANEELTIANSPVSFTVSSPDRDSLHPFRSDAAMEAYLKQGMNRGASDSSNLVRLEAFATTDSSTSAGGATSRVSATNIQEAGVDEADTIKTDGEFLYSLRSCGSDSCVATFRLDAVAPTATDIGVYQPENDENFTSASSLYLIEDSPTGSDMLVTLSGQNRHVAWLDYWGWQNNELEIEFLDAANPASLRPIEKVTIDGSLISSRRIGDQLHVVTRYTPGLPGFVPYAFDEATHVANAEVLESASLTTLIPRVESPGVDPRDLIESRNCYITTDSVDENRNPGIITVTTIPLADPSAFESTCFLGNTETVYMTKEALYLATTRYEYQLLATDALIYDPEHTTSIHKFDLTGGSVSYTGSGSVQGHLGWSEDKRSFRMGTGGENGEYLNVVTSVGSTWGDSSSTRFNVLKDSGSGLQLVNAIDGIGKPGEQLYAARFVGDRAYLVTFRVIDPLYVIDLSNQDNPQIVGELEIEGYSDYLHPVGENLLLGFGKDAVPDDGASDFGFTRGAWYQGVKVSLFDVADPANPAEINSLVYGRRGSESEVLADHHGISFLPATDSEPFRFAIPIQVNDTPYDSKSFDPDSPSSFYAFTSKGLYSFEVTAAGVVETGYLQGTSSGQFPTFAPVSSFADRSVLTNSAVFYVNEGRVLAAPVQ
ncbi:MAG: beta-propeller domain-containing protein [Proteobacteria bacterium]|nr:beta-propeller domain-containing protein [Pseudomonadota bacterium]MDA0927169.1 beta-propeller domain-containing protein [Pseudomonadota bacterium]